MIEGTVLHLQLLLILHVNSRSSLFGVCVYIPLPSTGIYASTSETSALFDSLGGVLTYILFLAGVSNNVIHMHAN